MNKDILIFGGISTLGGSILTALCWVLRFNMGITYFCIGLIGFGFLTQIIGLILPGKKIIDVDEEDRKAILGLEEELWGEEQ
jgi:hypothetical protein